RLRLSLVRYTTLFRSLPVMVALGTWGMAHRTTSPELTIRSRLMAEDPRLVADLMDELREIHLGIPRPDPQATRASQRLQVGAGKDRKSTRLNSSHVSI